MFWRLSLIFSLIVIVVSPTPDHTSFAQPPPTETFIVETIIETSTVFPRQFAGTFTAIGDLTNDGQLDLVITTMREPGPAAQAAVFQRTGGHWDSGTLLEGPSTASSITRAGPAIVAPIRNDGLNWLIYAEHAFGNTGEWLRSGRYSGTALVENFTILNRFGWPGNFMAAAGDLNADGLLELWVTSRHGKPSNHLRRHQWDPNTQSYPGVEIKDGVDKIETVIPPQIADFVGDGSQSLIWSPRHQELDLVTYTPGAGVFDHTSTPIFSVPGRVVADFYPGNFDTQPGTDIAVITREVGSSTVWVISGGTFSATPIVTGIQDGLRLIRAADLDGDGISEIFATSWGGSLYAYDAVSGWRELANYPGITWIHGAPAREPGATQDELYFSMAIGGTALRVVQITVLNKPPVCDNATPSVDFLWPPLHQMETVNVLGVTDPEGDPVTIAITSIFQDEPTNGLGDGDMSPDGQGIGTDTAQIRAERSGTGNGRVYHISVMTMVVLAQEKWWLAYQRARVRRAKLWTMVRFMTQPSRN